MRLFIAIELPHQIKESIYQLISFKTAINGISMVRKENFHITLKFLGEVEENLIKDIINTLRRISNEFNCFTLKITNPGAFPDKIKPRVIWIGTEENQILKQMVKRIDAEMEPLGFKTQDKDFKSHITVARVKNFYNGRYLLEKISKRFSTEFFQSQFQVSEFVLMKSTLTPKGSIYDVLERFPLIK